MKERSSKRDLIRLTAVAALMFHSWLLAWSAFRSSPTIDETAHLAAGISHWHTGGFRLYPVNPPLIRLIASLPVIAARPTVNSDVLHGSQAPRPEFFAGRRFIELNGRRSFFYFALARWALIPVSLLGAYCCYRWAGELYGRAAGLTALLLWCFSPNVLANAQLITPDSGAAAIGVVACYAFWRWLKSPVWRLALAVGIALGVAQLSKMTWIVLFVVWPATWVTYRLLEGRQNRRAQSASPLAAPLEAPPDHAIETGSLDASAPPIVRRELGMIAVIILLAVYVLNLGYAFEGTFTRLGDFRFFSDTLKGDEFIWGNRFSGGWLASLPVPLPKDYLRGIDLQKSSFETNRPSYLAGEFRRGGWWYYYLYGLAVKVPLGTWALVLLALVLSVRRSFQSQCKFPRSACCPVFRDTLVLVLPIMVLLAFVSANTGVNRHLRYVLPIFPFAFIWTSQVAQFFELRRWKTAAVVGMALAWSVGSSLWVYPHSGAYFNELAGGPKNGHAHLICSNIDWGQNLLYLEEWLNDHPEARPLRLAYYGRFDPRVAGIQYRLPPKAPPRDRQQFISGEDYGPKPGWHAVSVPLLRGEPTAVADGEGGWTWLDLYEYNYFLQFEPVARVGYGIYVYHITVDDANRVRRELGLRELTSDSPAETEGDTR